MPNKEEILNGLQTIVNNYTALAIIWHVIFYILLAGLLFVWRPSNKLLALIISLPVLSVAILAWVTGNPFNGLLFTVLTVLIIIFGLKTTTDTISTSQASFMIAGIVMISFGIIYPHFITADTFLKYLYASPVGLIPCPTLSIIIGLLLIYNGLASPSITLTMIIFGLFYGIFGVLKLGVYLDIFLIFGTLALLTKYVLSVKG